MDAPKEEASFEVTNPTFGTLKIRGTDWVGLGTFVLLITIGLAGYLNAKESSAHQTLQNTQMIVVLRELADAQKDANKQAKLLACIVSRPEPQRPKEFESDMSFCQRFSR